MSDYIDIDSKDDHDTAPALHELRELEPVCEALNNSDRMRLLTARRRRIEDMQEDRKLRDELGLYEAASGY